MPEMMEIPTPNLRPTAEKPLLGQTVLVVEDSRYACEALRLLCLRSGARIRRADSLKAAARHLAVYRPTVILVDLGLPDGSGLDLIQSLDPNESGGVIVGMSGDDTQFDRAIQAGAHDFFVKPLSSLAKFQSTILRHLPQPLQPAGPRLVDPVEIEPDKLAFRDDLGHVANLLSDAPSQKTLAYACQFLSGVARSAKDRELAEATTALAKSGSATQLRNVQTLLSDRMATTVPV